MGSWRQREGGATRRWLGHAHVQRDRRRRLPPERQHAAARLRSDRAPRGRRGPARDGAAAGRATALIGELSVVKSEQIELTRSKLKSHADEDRENVNVAQNLAERASAMAEEVRVKDEQLGLLKQSIALMEEEVVSKEGSNQFQLPISVLLL